MSDALVFPDTRAAVRDLLDGVVLLGNPVRAVYTLPVNGYASALEGAVPVALVTAGPGAQGYIERIEPVTVEVYAEGSTAIDTLEAVTALIVGIGIEAPGGVYLDEIRVLSSPVDTPSPVQSESLNRAVATYEVTSRPL